MLFIAGVLYPWRLQYESLSYKPFTCSFVCLTFISKSPELLPSPKFSVTRTYGILQGIWLSFPMPLLLQSAAMTRTGFLVTLAASIFSADSESTGPDQGWRRAPTERVWTGRFKEVWAELSPPTGPGLRLDTVIVIVSSQLPATCICRVIIRSTSLLQQPRYIPKYST